MKLYFDLGNVPDRNEIHEILNLLIREGKVCHSLLIKTNTSGKARKSKFHTFTHFLELQLHALQQTRGRRSGNSGSYGAMQDGTYAATFDEWGFFLAELYERYPHMRVGNTNALRAEYIDREHFHHRTGMTYSQEMLEAIKQGAPDPYPYTLKTSRKGRRGFGRHGEDESRWFLEGAIYQPRSGDFLEKLHTGQLY